jgi:hypothetical protein
VLCKDVKQCKFTAVRGELVRGGISYLLAIVIYLRQQKILYLKSLFSTFIVIKWLDTVAAQHVRYICGTTDINSSTARQGQNLGRCG